MKLKDMDKETWKAVKADVHKALEAVADKHGLEFGLARINALHNKRGNTYSKLWIYEK